jgi:hypothetical protein
MVEQRSRNKRFNGHITNVLKTHRFNGQEDLAQALTGMGICTTTSCRSRPYSPKRPFRPCETGTIKSLSCSTASLLHRQCGNLHQSSEMRTSRDALHKSSGKRALRIGMGRALQGQILAIAQLWRGFATPQTARVRRCTRRGDLCRASLDRPSFQRCLKPG